MKTFEDICGSNTLAVFPPGHFFHNSEGFVRYYQPLWFDYCLATHDRNLKLIHDSLVDAVIKRLMSDAPLGVLLSGGLDSSLVSSIAAREMKRRGLVVHSFSIGVDHNSPDLIAARKVARHIGTQHHEFHFSVEVVLSGEGADEIFGGYLYFHNAPNDEEFQKETIDRVLHLYTADCLRADKSTMAHSVEVRVPFLDKAFLDVSILTAPQYKRPHTINGRDVEKYILRKAFDEDTYLPHEILWRQKEQFSDGVGYSWIDQLVAHCEKQVTDEEFSKAEELYPHNTPRSKEAFYMRQIFHELFPSDNAAKTVRKWIPKWQASQDPSGRASHVHDHSLNKGKETEVIRYAESRPHHA
ncbi:hypothetical protein RB195_024206 [Necator americanus]|uniref:Asparagine synthetase domain-containing protein n=1 Tax=Necator americanus TaxID=51031 RepID=A0ABR1EPI7_NECAM